tara:strand:+ start:310 stop:477 length:168 start_codon:yes stop_codon:yes gene_type:complete
MDDRPALEIEITPEMIHAGSSALTCLDFYCWNGPEIARQVFVDMVEASRIPASKG